MKKTKDIQKNVTLAQHAAEQLSESRKRGLKVRTGLVGGEFI